MCSSVTRYFHYMYGRDMDRKRTPLAVWTSVGLEVMLAMWTQAIVSAWSDDGHLHATRYNEAAVSIAGGEAADCGRGIGRGSIGGAGCTGAWSQRQSGVQLVQVVSGGATGAAERGQTVAGASRSGEVHPGDSNMV